MASAARDRLGKTLRGDSEPASSTERTVRMDALALDVEGFGRAEFPLTPAKARKLITLGKAARFGRGEDTLTDPEVRDTWEIPAGLVRATWDPGVLSDVLDTLKEDFGLPNAAELDVDLHSLLVYEPGQFFLRHQDTEKTDEMIGTLVVTLPSAYAGGELMIGRGEDWKAYRGSRDSLSLVAFYADCQHEVLKLRSGYRITLTYNLILRGDSSPRQEGDAGTVAELADLLREHFSAPATHSWGQRRADPPSRLVYLRPRVHAPRAEVDAHEGRRRPPRPPAARGGRDRRLRDGPRARRRPDHARRVARRRWIRIRAPTALRRVRGLRRFRRVRDQRPDQHGGLTHALDRPGRRPAGGDLAVRGRHRSLRVDPVRGPGTA